MAEIAIDPTLGPILARTGDERAVLESFLDFHRAIVMRKLHGLADVDARRRLVPSLTTLAGLVKHLTLVERNWFSGLLAPEPGEVYQHTEEKAAAGFILDDADTVQSLLAGYERACARSRAVAARFDLDHVVPHPHPLLGEVSLRWILTHLIEETARHAGHADILRELTDGSTGAL
ncbi:DinB family protein [Micromonospora sp. RTGN7]|uniref:DinB family protein n=1 Tax=Micromonospora sp. RTGN7 TaxID=3016526 RepID=UPI0029FF3FF7|nr:DinB family protein [Micromonospora sp. RTGN7]